VLKVIFYFYLRERKPWYYSREGGQLLGFYNPNPASMVGTVWLDPRSRSAAASVDLHSQELLNSTQSTKNTVITAIKSSCIQGAVLSAKRSSGARPRCGSVAPRRDYVI